MYETCVKAVKCKQWNLRQWHATATSCATFTWCGIVCLSDCASSTVRGLQKANSVSSKALTGESTMTSFANIKIVVYYDFTVVTGLTSELPQNALIVNKHLLYSIKITVQSITLQKSSFLFLTIRIFMIVVQIDKL